MMAGVPWARVRRKGPRALSGWTKRAVRFFFPSRLKSRPQRILGEGRQCDETGVKSDWVRENPVRLEKRGAQVADTRAVQGCEGGQVIFQMSLSRKSLP